MTKNIYYLKIWLFKFFLRDERFREWCRWYVWENLPNGCQQCRYLTAVLQDKEKELENLHNRRADHVLRRMVIRCYHPTESARE